MKKSLLTTSIILALSVSGLTGCESVNKVTGAVGNLLNTAAGRGIITKEISEFDGKAAVRMTADDLQATNRNNGRQIMLGALWSQNYPNQVALLLDIDEKRSRGRRAEGLDGLLGKKENTSFLWRAEKLEANVDGKIDLF